MIGPQLFGWPLEQGRRRIAVMDTALAAREAEPGVVLMQPVVGGPHAYPDPERVVISVSPSSGPVEKLSAETDATVGAADHQAMDVDGRLLAPWFWPVRIVVRVSGDRRGRGPVIPDNPGLSRSKMSQYAAVTPGLVGPRLSPLVGVLST